MAKLGYFFAISLGRVDVPSIKIVINLLMTNEKLPCKGKSYRQADILLLYYKDSYLDVFEYLLIL